MDSEVGLAPNPTPTVLQGLDGIRRTGLGLVVEAISAV